MMVIKRRDSGELFFAKIFDGKTLFSGMGFDMLGAFIKDDDGENYYFSPGDVAIFDSEKDHVVSHCDGYDFHDYYDVEEYSNDVYEINESISKLSDSGDVSDGYHTFSELYEFRKMYNAILFNHWFNLKIYDVHKSKRHYDGEECFGGGWFIVVAILPYGQISNHYRLEDWDLFQVTEYDKAKYEFDGHTSKDVLNRLNQFLISKK